jgi:hypothetical protein
LEHYDLEAGKHEPPSYFPIKVSSMKLLIIFCVASCASPRVDLTIFREQIVVSIKIKISRVIAVATDDLTQLEVLTKILELHFIAEFGYRPISSAHFFS